MAVFLITCDLRNPDFDYEPLFEALKTIRADQIQDSVWRVDTPSTVEIVYEYLWRHMHSKRDRLFVVPYDKSREYRAEFGRRKA
jgi:hypothetical protein